MDYKRLLSHFATKGRLVRASYFTAICETEEFQPMRPLLDFIQYNGWNVVTKPAREFTNDAGQRKVKGNMHVNLIVDAIAVTPHTDHAIQFSGDRDFCPLVRRLKAKGERVSVISKLMTTPAFIADELRRQSDAFIDLDGLHSTVCHPTRPATPA